MKELLQPERFYYGIIKDFFVHTQDTKRWNSSHRFAINQGPEKKNDHYRNVPGKILEFWKRATKRKSSPG